jgi:uncharacterized protein YfbU (UPF0304 family)
MKLTRKDRLLLSNQYSILKALYPEDSEHYDRYKTIVEEGYITHYRDLFAHIDERGLSEEDAHEVMEILSMFEAFQDSVSGAGEIGKTESWLKRFPGFDNNSEWDYLGYLDFLVKKRHTPIL